MSALMLTTGTSRCLAKHVVMRSAPMCTPLVRTSCPTRTTPSRLRAWHCRRRTVFCTACSRLGACAQPVSTGIHT